MTRTTALIGAGYWGKNLARNLYQIGTLDTICECNESLHARYRDLYPDVNLTDASAVFENSEITEVFIAVPGPFHFPLVRDALLSGKDVYVEKPLCLTWEDGQELVTIAKQMGRVLMVGHILQYHPCIQRIKEILESGLLGDLQYISSHRLNLGKILTNENALWALAPHDVSVILSLCGGELPTQLRSLAPKGLSPGVPDMAMTTMNFANGVSAHIYVSWLHPQKEQKLTLVGSKGMLVFDDTKPWEEKLLLYRNPVSWSDGIPLENPVKGEAQIVPVKEPLKEECLHFYHCCEHRLSPISSGEEGVRVLRVLQAAQSSLEEGGEAKDPANLQSTCLLA
jgi:UDP-2-acetamido-3-amino-2,3-dideoxy-glucuronate N-acetyltransferase